AGIDPCSRRRALGRARRAPRRGPAQCHAQGARACARIETIKTTRPRSRSMTGEDNAMDTTRRSWLAGASAIVAMTSARTALGGWEPSERYPDPAIQILDPSFAKYRIAQASVERLGTGMRWCEGPVYFGDARCLLWSDIPNNRIMRWDEGTGRVSVY